jgi:hypothetical protein
MHGKSNTTPAVRRGAASAAPDYREIFVEEKDLKPICGDGRARFVVDYLYFLAANGYECDFFTRQPDGLYKSIDGVTFTQAQLLEIARTGPFKATDGAGALVDGTGKPKEIYLTKNLGI